MPQLPPLKLEALDEERGGRPTYRLLEPFEVRLQLAGEDAIFWCRVPQGSVTDFASIPRWVGPLPLWSIIGSPAGAYSKAAVVHDFLYESRSDVDRFTADAIFRALMKISGVPTWKRIAMYYAVRFFGNPSAWKR